MTESWHCDRDRDRDRNMSGSHTAIMQDWIEKWCGLSGLQSCPSSQASHNVDNNDHDPRHMPNSIMTVITIPGTCATQWWPWSRSQAHAQLNRSRWDWTIALSECSLSIQCMRSMRSMRSMRGGFIDPSDNESSSTCWAFASKGGRQKREQMATRWVVCWTLKPDEMTSTS